MIVCYLVQAQLIGNLEVEVGQLLKIHSSDYLAKLLETNKTFRVGEEVKKV